MMTPTVVAVVLIAVWLGLYLMDIGLRPRPAEVVSPRRHAKPYYNRLTEHPTDTEMRDNEIRRWDDEGGASRPMERLIPALRRFAPSGLRK